MACPVPLRGSERVLLGHGSGGRLSGELLRDVFLKVFRSPVLGRLDDQAVLEIGSERIAFTTDSFVVQPLFFRGGDIGSLAVHGTINDLAMGGAEPLFLSAAFILEEGLPMETLARAAEAAGVEIVTGDTKVVERGKGDGLFVTTTGIGRVPAGVELSASKVRVGDVVLVSGYVGDHGVAILSERESIGFETSVASDSAALHGLVRAVLRAAPGVRVMRDPTRGGVSSATNELAEKAGVGIELEESAIPVRAEVRAACELLGFDPLYVANEGKLIAVVAAAEADAALAAMRGHELGKEAARIGAVVEGRGVRVRTGFGGCRVVEMLDGDQLPRIC
jgi:hydrogenase expression/formation protein HypE